ncbi:MAG TPA: hypothetical protein VGO78_01470 [Acidimicrobiales bacterium]|nr:hypothetical protein [Acidimicrobiales bacterium]
MGTDEGIDDGTGDGDDTADGTDEVAELRRERDELATRLSRVERRGARRGRLRGAAVVVLVVVGCVSFTAAAVGVWVRHNVTDTDVWVARAGPLADDPAVRAALGRWLSDEVIDVVDPAKLLAEVLPERGRVLAVPLAGAVDGFIRDRVDRFLASDQFETLWVAANEQAHRRLVRILRGDAPHVTAGDESVTINLVPVIDEALARISAASPEILGRQVDLPDLSVEDLPKDAVTRLGNALGVHLDDDFGQVTVYDEGRLAALQDAVDQARRLLVLVAVLAVVSLVGALALSGRRRRTLLQILAGLALGIALVRRLGIRAEREVVASITDPVNREAAAAVTDRFLGPLLDVTRGLLVALVVVAAVAVLSGPYPQVVRLRTATAAGARQLGSTIRTQISRPGAGEGEGGDDDRVGAWIETHRGTLQGAGVVVGVLALVLLDLSFVGLVVLAALVGLFELVVRPAGGVEAP